MLSPDPRLGPAPRRPSQGDLFDALGRDLGSVLSGAGKGLGGLGAAASAAPGSVAEWLAQQAAGAAAGAGGAAGWAKEQAARAQAQGLVSVALG